MDPVTGALISNLLQIGTSLYISYQKSQGKTEEEINAMLDAELKKAMAFDPNTIKDV